MELDQYADSHLCSLLQRVRYWQQLDSCFKKLLPTPLHAHLRVICIENGELIVYSTSPMAAARLKMLLPPLLPKLQNFNSHIQNVKIKVRPIEHEKTQQKDFHISTRGLNAFQQTAHKLQNSAPQLAEAISRLIQNHQ